MTTVQLNLETLSDDWKLHSSKLYRDSDLGDLLFAIEQGFEWKEALCQDEALYKIFNLSILKRVIDSLLKKRQVDGILMFEIAHFMQRATKYIASYIDEDAEWAIETLKMLFTMSKQYLFFQNHGMEALTSEMLYYSTDEDVATVYTNEEWVISCFTLANANTFYEFGGIDAIIGRFKDPNNRPDLERCNEYISLFQKIHDLFELEYSLEKITEFIDVVVEFFLSATNEELAVLKKNSLPDIFQNISRISATLNSGTPTKEICQFRLKMAVKLLNTSVIGKRLDGLNQIKHFISLTEFGGSMNTSEDEEIVLDIEYIGNWLFEIDIIELLFGETSHMELLRRSGDVIKVLPAQKLYNNSMTDKIWNSLEGNHEALLHIVWTNFIALSEELSSEQLQYLYEKALTFPLEKYDQQYIDFLYHISISGIKRVYSENGDADWYALHYLWDLCQDNKVKILSEGAFTAAYAYFEALCGWQYISEQRFAIVEKCVDNIKSGNSVVQALKIISVIINTNETNYKDLQNDPKNEFILYLENSYGLVELLLNDLHQYIKSATELFNRQDPTTIDNMKIAGSYTHLDNLNERLNFLALVLSYSKLSFNKEQIDFFWENVIANAINDTQLNLGFSWLSNARSNAVEDYLSFDSDLTEYLCITKFSTLDMSSITANAFDFFEYFFRFVNWKNDKFQQSNNVYIILDYNLDGIETLWNIALQSQAKRVGERAIELLNRLQLNPSDRLSGEIAINRQSFIEKCMSALTESYENIIEPSTPNSSTLKASRALELLTTFLESFEMEKNSISHGDGLRGNPISLRYKFVGVDEDEKELEVHDNMTIHDLKVEIIRMTEEKELSPDFFAIYFDSKPLNGKLKIKKTKLKNNSLVSVTTTQNAVTSSTTKLVCPNDENPNSICEREEFFEQFFLLLNLPGELGEHVWDILMNLSTNKNMYNSILNISETTNIGEILDPTNMYRLFYSLQICESLISQNTDDIIDWKNLFVSIGSVQHLVNVILQTNFLCSGQGGIPCYATILRIINYFTKSFENCIPAETQNDVVSKLIEDTLAVSIKKNIQGSIPRTPFKSSRVTTSSKREIKVVTPSQDVTSTLNDSVCEQAFRTLSFIFTTSESALAHFICSPAFDAWLIQVLLRTSLTPTRRFAKDLLISASSFYDKSYATKIAESALKCLDDLKNFSESEFDYLTTSTEYFDLLSYILEMIENKSESLLLVFETLFTMLKNHPIVEKRGDPIEDSIIMGILSTLRAFIKSEFTYSAPNIPQLIDEIFDNCLFNVPSIGSDITNGPPKCKSQASRKIALDTLSEIASHPEQFIQIAKKLLNEFDNLGKSPEWDYFPVGAEKSATGHVGLYNMGATCYMNSLLQQFHMNPQFRFEMLSAKVPEEEKEDNLLYQIQQIFTNLQESAQKAYEPYGFTQAYKDWDGIPMNPRIQMDAQEFYNMLIDKLEGFLEGQPQKESLKNFYGGELIYQVISHDCEHISSRVENFYTLSVPVKGKRKLSDSLDLFVSGDLLDGDNKYHCDSCDKKVKAVRRCCVNSLPNNLIVHMQRFEFDIEVMARRKVNDYCEFDMKLNLEPYTKEGLARREVDGDEIPEPEHPLEFYDYDLAGIVVHTGTTEAGHYYSFIKDSNNGEWFQFNDSKVSPFSADWISDQCFGGYTTRTYYDATKKERVTKNVEKMNNAYMLFYTRSNPEKNPVETPVSLQQAPLAVPKPLYNEVWTNNISFLRDKHIFDIDFIDFAHNVSSLYPPENKPEPELDIQSYQQPEIVDLTFDISLKFFFQVLSHAKIRNVLPEFTLKMKTWYSCNIPSGQLLLKFLMEEPEWFRHVFFQCDTHECRYDFADIIDTVLKALRPFELEKYNLPNGDVITITEPDDEDQFIPDYEELNDINKGLMNFFTVTGTPASSILQFIEFSMGLHLNSTGCGRQYMHYWLIFQNFASMGHEERCYILSRGFLSVFLNVYLGQKSPNYEGPKSQPSKYEDWVISQMKHLMGTISQIVVACLLPRPEGGESIKYGKFLSSVDEMSGYPNELPPSQIIGDSILTLEYDDWEMITSDVFLRATMNEVVNPTAISALAIHLGWNNIKISETIIGYLVTSIFTNPKDHLDVLKELLLLEDEYQERRSVYAVERLIHVTRQLGKFKKSIQESIMMLVHLVPSNRYVKEYLLNNLGEWVEEWLFSNNMKLIRLTTELLIQELIGKRGYEVHEGISPPSISKLTDTEKVQPEGIITDESLRVINIFFELFFNYFSDDKSIVHMCTTYPGNAIARELGTDSAGTYILESYLRLFRWLIVSDELKEKFANKVAVAKLLNLFIKLDKNRKELDRNRLEMNKLLVHILEDNPEFVKELTQARQYFESIMNYHISLSPNIYYVEYNNESLPLFYQIMATIASDSEEFLERWIGNSNFLWGLRYTVFESPTYPEIVKHQKAMVHLAFNFDADFRRIFLNKLIEYGFAKINENFDLLMEITREFLITRTDKVNYSTSYGILHLAYSFSKISNLFGDKLMNYLNTILVAIDWLNDEDLTDNEVVAQISALEHCSDLKSRIEVVNSENETINELKERILSFCP